MTVVSFSRHPNKWLPSKSTTVCSAHFIGNKKSENPLHPSYLPTIFPGEENIKNLDQKIERFARHQHRMQRAGSVKEEKSYNQSVSRENQELQEAAPSTVDEGLDTNVTAEVQGSLDKSTSPVEEEEDNEVTGEVQGLPETSSPGPVDEEPDAPVEVKEVCRVCLAFHVKMYNIQEHNLCQMLYDIAGIKIISQSVERTRDCKRQLPVLLTRN
ncbi:hypothetical protein B5X24_HaOG215316 [Helicoverpa armigera]|uniref:THAP-type domain-containing protein n=1 Tax=Helicoverpa armigera TaxID=29058 RepID=A0A2W1B3E0_HELAM|nr:hypothetical protein B5X24_HaOG215316 [Helicoverpa armigera]